MAHHGTTSHGTPWHVPTMRTMVCHDNAHPGMSHHDSCRIQKNAHPGAQPSQPWHTCWWQENPRKQGWWHYHICVDHASDCLSSVAHVPQHGKDETFLVTYVSHSDSIELVNLGFLSFFHPSCPSLPKRVQFSSCWQRLSDADLCHKGTCMHACVHACSSIQCHIVSPCAQPVFQRPKHRVISNCQVSLHYYKIYCIRQ